MAAAADQGQLKDDKGASVNNEKTTSTTASVNGETVKTTAQTTPKPQKAREVAAAAPEAIDSLYRYKPIFKQPAAYIKYKEPIYEGYENFTYEETNYEITERDIKWL